MLLRKLVAALCPLLLCIVLCLLYRWLDGVLAAGLFGSFLLKGLLLGVALALIIPLAGLRCHAKGLQPWLYVGAALLGHSAGDKVEITLPTGAVVMYEVLEVGRADI